MPDLGCDIVNPRKNPEGYTDPTAYYGTKNIIKEEERIEKLSMELIQTCKLFAELAGFEVVGRIQLRHKQTGKIFK